MTDKAEELIGEVKVEDVKAKNAEAGQPAKESVEKINEDTFFRKADDGTITEKEVEDYLFSKHSEVYSNDREALKLASAATVDLRRVGRIIKEAQKRNQSRGRRTVGDGFSRRFINSGYIDFNGTKSRDTRALAEAMQVYRDPRFETFRIVYMKGDTIVGTEGVSARMPGFSPTKQKGEFANDRYASVSDRMNRLGLYYTAFSALRIANQDIIQRGVNYFDEE